MAHLFCTYSSVKRRRLRRCATGLLGALLVNSPLAFANPTGMEVVHGALDSSTVGNTLTITNLKGDSAIVNWQSFNISSGERTHFNLGNPYRRILNRVVGPGSSLIDGALSSDGSVFIINRNGIAVGGGGVVDTAALVMSTLDVDNNAFMNREELIFSGSGASITNNGSITADRSISLLGSGVNNVGSIHSRGGDITLAAGSQMRISGTGFDNVFIEVPGDATLVANNGSMSATNGKIALLAAIQHNNGTADTPRLIMDTDGNVEITVDPVEPTAEVDSDPETDPSFGIDHGAGDGCRNEPACEPASGGGSQDDSDRGDSDPTDTETDTENPVADGSEDSPPQQASTDGSSAPGDTTGDPTPAAPHSPSFVVDLTPANLNLLMLGMVTENAVGVTRLQESMNETATNDADVEAVASRAANEDADTENVVLQCKVL